MNGNDINNQQHPNHIKIIYLNLSEDVISNCDLRLSSFLQSLQQDVAIVSYENIKNVKDSCINCLLVSDSIESCQFARDHDIAHLLLLTDDNRTQPLSGIRYAITDFEGIDLFYLNRVYERCHHIPWFIMNTERCYLKELAPANLDALYDVYAAPEMTRFTEGLYEDRAQELQYMKDYIKHVYEFSELGIWGIFLKETNELIGRAGLSYREEYDTPELGYVIKKDYWQQGYAFEVCQAILKFAFENYDFHLIRVLTHPDNIASIKLCEKLGFRYDQHVTIKGESFAQYINRTK